MSNIPAGKENGWKSIKSGLLMLQMRWTKGGCQEHKEIWWQDKTVDNAVKVKRKAWRQWKS